MILSLILGLVVGGLSVIFALQNVFPVTVTFLSWEITASLALLIAISVLVGLVIAALVSIPGAIANAMTISALRKENKRLNDDLHSVSRSDAQTVIVTSPTGEQAVIGKDI